MSEARPGFRLAGPVLDAANPVALAEFYERLLGWPIARQEGPRPGNPATDGWAIVRSPDGRQKIEVQWEPNYAPPTWPPADGEQLMMIHLDFGVDDLDAAVEWAIAAGATVAEHQPQPEVRVMLDPEGHPFCLFPDSG
jgi:predicted enzyme related to lactoylglutathione lyase